MPVGPVLADADFTPTAVALLVAGGACALLWVVVFAIRWAASFPDLPPAGPETSEPGPEPPAIANLLVNRCHVTTAAAAATLVDLAARRHLELFQAGPERFVVRLCPDRGEPLTDYEQQVLVLVREKATGGSAPLEAIELDESAAAAWHSSFAKKVVADAKARGLVRGRWTRYDGVVLGVLGGLALLLLAGGLSVAGVREEGQGDGERFDREDWFLVALGAWLAVMAVVASLRSIRYSAAGEGATAHWLGMKRFLRHQESFDQASPAAVAIWNRLLGYGAALGVARGTVGAIPLEAEDDEVAWSRVGGDWHQIHVEYPTRFGYGQRPLPVLGGGVVRTVFFGAIAFAVLPGVVDALWSVGASAFDDFNVGREVILAVAAVFVALFGGIAVVLVLQVAEGVIRTARAWGDLHSTETVTGQVVKHHRVEEALWFAVDPGGVDEVKALRPGDDGKMPPRGATVRLVLTPRLRHVVSVEVLDHSGMVQG